MDLMSYKFICPHCGKEYITYVEREKYKELVARQRMISEIFEKYPMFYSGIFTVGFCSECLSETFDIRGKSYCCEPSSPDEDKIYSEIQDLCKV